MVKKILTFVFIIILLISSSGIAFAEEGYIPDEFDEIEDTIPDDVADKIPDGIFSGDTDDFAESVSVLTTWEYILDYVFEILGLNLDQALRVFAITVALLVICSLLNMLKDSFNNSALETVISMISSAAIMATIIELSRKPLEDAINLLDYIRIFINTASPTLSAMYAMGGNISGAIVHNYGLIVFLSILENVIILSLELILGICMALALSSAFMQGNNLVGISNAIKKTFTFFLGLIMLIFTTVISTQTLLASKADTISSKTAKLLAMQVIPVVGSTVGESLRTAGASIEYLRSNVGVALIIILILVIAPTIISISIYRLILIAGNAVSGLLGCEREGRLMLEISSLFGYVLAILAISCIVVIYLLTVFAKCSSPLI